METTTKKRKTTVPRILDGKYYEIINQNDTKIEAKCTHCGKHRKGDIRSTENFMEHYSSFHPMLVNEVQLYKKGNIETTSILKQTTLFPMATLSTQAVGFCSSHKLCFFTKK